MLTPSLEQQNIVNLVGQFNLVVDSVAGSGKTTTNLFIAQNYPDKNILLLTYNKRLKDETVEKFSINGISNTTIHTFHSFCYAYYLQQAIKDKEVLLILKEQIQSKLPYKFDIIIIDEAQDLTPTYYQLVLKICKNNSAQDFTICIMGDQKQCINQYLKADLRFMTLAEQFFKGLNKYDWKQASLSTSFRLTNQMCTFINKNVLSQQRILSKKNKGSKIRYLVSDSYIDKTSQQFIRDFVISIKKGRDYRIGGKEEQIQTKKLIKKYQLAHKSVVLEVLFYLNKGYKFEDIFIIAPSLKIKTPAAAIASDLSYFKIPIHLANSEGNQSQDLFKNKIVFLTYHKAKGLERKVVIVLGFDESYYKYYSKEKGDVCANTHYVALTRSSEYLTVVQYKTQGKLPFLDFKEDEKHFKVIGEQQRIPQKIIQQTNYLKEITPQQLINHIPQDILQKVMSMSQYKRIQEKGSIIQIPFVSQQKFKAFDFKQNQILELHEIVNDINEIAIRACYDIQINKQCFIFNQIEGIQQKSDKHLNCKSILPKNQKKFNEIVEKEELLTNIKNENISDLLFVSNYWNGIYSQQPFRINQIQQYNWMNLQTLIECVDRILQIIDVTKGCEVQEYFKFQDSYCLTKNSLALQSFIQFIQDEIILEIIFQQEIQDEHLLLLSIQKYLYLKHYKTIKKVELERDIIQLEEELLANPRNNYEQNQTMYYRNKNNKYKKCTFIRFSKCEKNAYIITEKAKSKSIKRHCLIHNDIYKLLQQMDLVDQDQFYKFKLLNIYDGEIIEELTPLEDLEKMVNILVEQKYDNSNNIQSNDDFINEIIEKNKAINL